MTENLISKTVAIISEEIDRGKNDLSQRFCGLRADLEEVFLSGEISGSEMFFVIGRLENFIDCPGNEEMSEHWRRIHCSLKKIGIA